MDTLSKFKDWDNWSVDDVTFKELDADFHFELDVFADELNAKIPKFFQNFIHLIAKEWMLLPKIG